MHSFRSLCRHFQWELLCSRASVLALNLRWKSAYKNCNMPAVLQLEGGICIVCLANKQLIMKSLGVQKCPLNALESLNTVEGPRSLQLNRQTSQGSKEKLYGVSGFIYWLLVTQDKMQFSHSNHLHFPFLPLTKPTVKIK